MCGSFSCSKSTLIALNIVYIVSTLLLLLLERAAAMPGQKG
jgi:hypothetical protein